MSSIHRHRSETNPRHDLILHARMSEQRDDLLESVGKSMRTHSKPLRGMSSTETEIISCSSCHYTKVEALRDLGDWADLTWAQARRLGQHDVWLPGKVLPGPPSYGLDLFPDLQDSIFSIDGLDRSIDDEEWDMAKDHQWDMVRDQPPPGWRPSVSRQNE